MPESMSEKNKNALLLKMQKMRVELGERDIKKSGYNDYSKFNYFELSDFLPEINKIMLAHNVASIYKIVDDKATLTFHDLESNEVLVFSIPATELSIKGANTIQNIGGLTTYTRRYLYMIAFEIAENDEIDHAKPEKNSKKKAAQQEEQNQPIQEKIDKIKLASLRDCMSKKGVEEKTVLDRYKLSDLSQMTIAQYADAMKGLAVTKEKKKEDVDLGL